MRKRSEGDLDGIPSYVRRTTSAYSPQQLPIGVFDSGVGGLTVLKELQQQLPQESFLYFGDTANVPYGTRSQSEILGFVRQILRWMTSQPIKMAIMACNTSSALALDEVRAEFDIPILGIILPGARAAVKQGKRIGVIATPATVASKSYPQAIQEVNATAQVFQEACPEFVPLIEHNRIREPETLHIVHQHLKPLLQQGIDTLVYGCTHYPHLSGVIRQILPPHVKTVDPAVYITTAAKQELKLLQLQNGNPSPTTRFFVSGCPEQFAELSYQWLGFLPVVEKVVLPELASPQSVEAVEQI
ncbi:glutamate racemase [Acaryochloris sp. 'Moss Beach']|uniref:glutamate racemase n=1 Tax=Acaryochloris sp. 'Moss Beach' TaxID=2740837 RepID=UPI0037BF7B78